LANQIKIKRGLQAGLPAGADGEPLWTTDTFRLYVGQGGVSKLVGEADFLKLSGGTMTGALTLSGDPSSALHAATKQYVDAYQTGLDVKASCRGATTAALPANTRTGNVLTASANGALPAQDGVTLVLNDRILVKNEATGANNGLYYVSQVGDAGTPWTLTRVSDADSDAEVTAGMYTFVEEGTTNADTGWVLTTNNPVALNTTALAFTQFTGAGEIIAGAGLTKTGNTIDVGAGDGIQADADSITVKLDGTTLTKGASGLKITNGTEQYQFLVTGATPFAPAYASLSTLAGTGLNYAAGALSVAYGYTANTALEGNATIDGGTW
jgi:hypothetical protein